MNQGHINTHTFADFSISHCTGNFYSTNRLDQETLYDRFVDCRMNKQRYGSLDVTSPSSQTRDYSADAVGQGYFESTLPGNAGSTLGSSTTTRPSDRPRQRQSETTECK